MGIEEIVTTYAGWNLRACVGGLQDDLTDSVGLTGLRSCCTHDSGLLQ